MAEAISAPGDVFIVPDPSYPIHTWGFVIAGAGVISIPNQPGEVFFSALKKTLDTAQRKPVALVVNYPCNPTAMSVDLAFFEQVIDICRHYGIYVLSDLAYCELYYDGNPPPSILQVKGAKDLAVEFTTMSKTYSMAGWRIGYAVGNKKLIAALTKIKSYLDYGTFLPIQVAATAALNGPQDYVVKLRKMYKERRDVLANGLIDAGWDNVVVPNASMFLWAPVPGAYADIGCLAFSKLLLQHADVAVAPGVGFGLGGEGYVRIALVENKHRLRQAVRNIKQFLAADPRKHNSRRKEKAG
jgi:alanine-synthesizing transaminase